MRITARFFLVLFFVGTLLSFVTKPLFAQANTYMSADTNPDVPQNMHTYTQSIILEGLSSVFCLLAGYDYTNPQQQCLGFDPTTHKIGYVPNNGGLIGTVATGIVALYTPPISTTQYISYLTHDFGLAKKADAAQIPSGPSGGGGSSASTANTCSGGVGFCGIAPLIGIWTTFRNIVYLLFVVIFILVGFGIMLRQKIDPRTVMSIENQVPKLIIALVLVTFSFAIAGLMIDGMWLGSFVVVNVLTSADKTNPISQNTVNNNFFDNPLGFANNVLPGGVTGVALGEGGSLRDVVRGILTPDNTQKLGLTPQGDNLNCSPTNDPFCGLHEAVNNIVGGLGDFFGGIFGLLIASVIGILGIIIVLIAIIVSLVRLWFSLLLSYVYILLDVLLGPFMIAFGVLPGSKIGFGSWARDILANLLAFPTAIGMFLLARLMMDAFASATPVNGVSSGTSQLFVTPLIGNPNGTAGNGNPLGFLIGLGIILMTPQVVAMMKALLKVQENKFGQAIGQSLAGGAGQLVGTVKSVGRTAIASREAVMKKDPTTGKYEWQERGGAAIWSNLFGR